MMVNPIITLKQKIMDWEFFGKYMKRKIPPETAEFVQKGRKMARKKIVDMYGNEFDYMWQACAYHGKSTSTLCRARRLGTPPFGTNKTKIIIYKGVQYPNYKTGAEVHQVSITAFWKWVQKERKENNTENK